MDNNKAPDLDGFGAYFFKQVWEVIKKDVLRVVQHFFSIGFLLKEVNCTILAFVPKVANPSSFKDNRPIACCNTIYKCTTNIIANRLKPILPYCLSKAQIAFVGGRNSGDNILLC